VCHQIGNSSGIINLPLIAQTLKEIDFNGPTECQPEWPELGSPHPSNGLLRVILMVAGGRLRNRIGWLITALAAAPLYVNAQWAVYRDPTVPRTRDGKTESLCGSAPTPWQTRSFGNLAG
jgi:hypothetical protein